MSLPANRFTRPVLILLISALSLSVFTSSGISRAEQTISPPAKRVLYGNGYVGYTLGVGTAIQVLLQSPVDTSINQLGDPVEAIMTHNIYVGEEKVLPQSTRFMGVISRLEPAKPGSNGILRIHFDQVKLADGDRLTMSAYVHTDDADHGWGGEVTSGSKAVASVQEISQLGEYNRTVFAGPRQVGNEIQLNPGDHWTLILEQPLTVMRPKEDP